jgi:hypothetical protein
VTKRIVALCLFLFCWSAPAQAAQVCAWMKEAIQADDVHDFELWLEADSRIDFLYQIGGKGVVTASMSGNSPSSATFSLDPGTPEKVWGYGSTLNPPGKIDFSVELHQMPADIFSDAPTPLLARFVFQRNVPQSETKAPATLAKKQCAVLKGGN